jgi:hypothetical protein
VSLDGGKLWRQAEITRYETPNPAGKLWCWIFWRFEVPLQHCFVDSLFKMYIQT